MQIHEITRRKLSEAGFGAGLATGLTSALSKVGVGAPDASAYQQSKTGGAGGQLGAYKATAGLVKTLTTTMQTAWAQTIKSYLEQTKDEQGNPVMGIAQLPPATQSMLHKDLMAMINNTIRPSMRNFDYQTIGNQSNDPDVVGAAADIKDTISKNADKIYQLTVSGTAKTAQLTQLFQDMVTNGIAPAQNLLTFTTQRITPRWGTDPTTKELTINLGAGDQLFNMSDPRHKEAWDDLQSGMPSRGAPPV